MAVHVQSPVPLSFPVLHDAKPTDTTLPAFQVSTTRGFLPRGEPITELPLQFAAIESLLRRMPIKTADGTPGLLASGELGAVVRATLPDLCNEIEKCKANLPLMNALYRDYAFLASAYLLEPCHQQFLKDGTYGLGRDTLPACIAKPMSLVAEL
jgi:indoleamine 2,3-dioxygenase